MPNHEPTETVLAVDVGNSRIKLGRFDPAADCVAEAQRGLFPIAAPDLPQPTETLELANSSQDGFDTDRLSNWCAEHIPPSTHWIVASVNRAASESLRKFANQLRADVTFHLLTHHDLDLPVEVDQPERVGIDRLVAALAANCVRAPNQPAIVVDHGSAITIDLVSADGAFCGGAILPGIAMSARALADGTDALPLVDVKSIKRTPAPVGDCTQAAIESGLWWGNVGAVRELVNQIAAGQSLVPQVLVTGGGGKHLAKQLASDSDLRDVDLKVTHLPHLVLAGIALAGQQLDGRLS